MALLALWERVAGRARGTFAPEPSEPKDRRRIPANHLRTRRRGVNGFVPDRRGRLPKAVGDVRCASPGVAKVKKAE
ncbi:MAG: hypothetical protein D6725_02325 [Planctomycetota bacterium]|nr:MAG: hypothetical protein D6725_02325 [Planctomycetota bacterium]